MTYRESVQRSLDALAGRLDPIITARLSKALNGLPWTTILSELDSAKGYPPKIYATTDLQCQLRMLTQRLGGLGYPFDDHNHTASVLGGELRIVRNRWAHNDEFTALDAWRSDDFVARLLDNLGDKQGADEAKAARSNLWDAVSTETGHPQEPSVSAPVATSALARMTTSDDEGELVEPDPAVLVRSDAGTPTIGAQREVFEPWPIVVVGDVSVLDNIAKKSAKEKVRAVASEIVEFEGPISLERLVDLVAESFDLHRVHPARAKKISYQISQCGLQIDGDKFVWPADLDPHNWHEFRPNSSEVNRPFTQISPVEIANSARFILGEASPQSLDRIELETRVLQTFGRKRRTKQFVKHLEGALAAL